MNIIESLQAELLQANCDVISVLRKARVISHKLNLSEFEEWTIKELNGYNDTDTYPIYRKNITGKIKYINPYRGWCPVLFYSTEQENNLSTREYKDSIPKIVDLLNNTTGTLTMSLPPEIIDAIWAESMTGPMETYLVLDKSTLKDITEQVKNKILDWVLILDDKGITGNEVSFSDAEKTKARNDPQIINYTTNIYGNVEDTQIQQGTNNSNQEL